MSDTAVFDRPTAGRAWFEAAIRDHLDLGHPERVSLIFGRQILAPAKPPRGTPAPVVTAWRNYDIELNKLIHHEGLAA